MSAGHLFSFVGRVVAKYEGGYGDVIDFIDDIGAFMSEIEALSPSELFDAASSVNPDTQWQDRSIVSTREDGPHLFIDLLINFIGYVSVQSNVLINCNPFPLNIHRTYEDFLIRQFARAPFASLMFNDGALCEYIHRGNYSTGRNWRMTNLILAGFFDLYLFLIRTSEVQIGHLFLIIKFATCGTDPSLAHETVFIPDIYDGTVREIIHELSRRYINDQNAICGAARGNRDYVLDGFHPYEYSIYAKTGLVLAFDEVFDIVRLWPSG